MNLCFYAGWLGDHAGNAFVEPFIILVILILNAVVGVWQEHNAENALEALKKLQPKNCIVIRGGVTQHEFDAAGLVPGDLVEVKVGDKVSPFPSFLSFFLRGKMPLLRCLRTCASFGCSRQLCEWTSLP